MERPKEREGCAGLPALDRRLDRNSPAPLIVAFSGGGDSLALLIAAKAWADGAGRRLIAVSVDHRLQPAGADWAAWCQARCGRLGVEHRTLVWAGAKPSTGLAAAARAARHGLIAKAARDTGAQVILMGHTADDRLEARLMREAGASCPEPREWAPAPLWPEGRGLFILRPLIAARRAEIREALTAAGETWIEDPANDDRRYARARARAALAGGRKAGPSEEPRPAATLLAYVTEGPAGDLTIDRSALTHPAARALIGAALLCAAGTDRPPRGVSLDRLMARLAADRHFVATLAGARIEADGSLIRVVREAGRRPLRHGASKSAAPPPPLRRGGALEGQAALTPPRCLFTGEVARGVFLPRDGGGVWDGRFEIEAQVPVLTVAALAGRASKLGLGQRAALSRVPAAARPSLPVVIDESGAVACPTLAPDPRVTVRSLVFARLAGALGAVNREAAIGRMAKTLATT